jgi:hypothetical protein
VEKLQSYVLDIAVLKDKVHCCLYHLLVEFRFQNRQMPYLSTLFIRLNIQVKNENSKLLPIPLYFNVVPFETKILF